MASEATERATGGHGDLRCHVTLPRRERRPRASCALPVFASANSSDSDPNWYRIGRRARSQSSPAAHSDATPFLQGIHLPSLLSMSDGFEVDRHHGGHAKLSLESRRAHQEVVAPSLPVMEFELVEVVFPARSDVQEVQEKPVRSLRSRVFASVPRARSDAGFSCCP